MGPSYRNRWSSTRKKFALRSLKRLVERLPSKKKNFSSLTTTNKWRGRKSENTSSGGRPSRLSPESKCLQRKLLRKTTFHQRSGKDRAPISHKDVFMFFTNRGTRKNTSHLQE